MLNMSDHSRNEEWSIKCGEVSSTQEDCVEIVFVGDTALAGQVGDVIRQKGSKFLFNEIPISLFDVDILCYNLECCLSNRGEVWEPKPVPFRGAAEFLSVFPQGKCKYVANIANNHFLDYGEDAALDTIESLLAYNMRYIGASGSKINNLHTTLTTPAGNVSLIGFAPSSHLLPNSRQLNVAAMSVDDMVSQVTSLKKKSDIVIASLHQGVEHSPYVERRSHDLTHQLVVAGADCIVCHHPHIIQGIEIYEGVPIFHSIGNFVIGLDFQQKPSARKSLALRLILNKKKLQKIFIEPFIIMDTLQPRPVSREEKQQIRKETEVLSLIFQSKFKLIINDLKCDGIKFHNRILSLCEMIRQKGIATSMKYYFGRLIAKFKSNIKSI